MNDDLNHIRTVLQTGSDEEKIKILKQMRSRIVKGEPSEYFDLARSQIGSRNNDVRWQSMIVVGEYIPSRSRNDEIWEVIRRYCGVDDDMQDALATVLLEHLLEHDFDDALARLREEVSQKRNRFVTDLLERCWPFGQAEQRWREVKDLIKRSGKKPSRKGHRATHKRRRTV